MFSVPYIVENKPQLNLRLKNLRLKACNGTHPLPLSGCKLDLGTEIVFRLGQARVKAQTNAWFWNLQWRA